MTLTQEQYVAVTKVAKKSGMDCWFYIRQSPSGDDYVQDLENSRRLSLRSGLRDLAEGVTSYHGVSENERKIFEELLDQFQIEKPEVD